MTSEILATAAFFSRRISGMTSRQALGAAIDLFTEGDSGASDAPEAEQGASDVDQGLRPGHFVGGLVVAVLALVLASHLGFLVDPQVVRAMAGVA